ncbi:IS1 family transposase [Lamprobacter modestohalophilus]
MVLEPVCCPHCDTDDVSKHGESKEGKKRYFCNNDDCPHKTFISNYTYQGCKPETKRKITDMALNGSGIRDTARVLKISPSTVNRKFKKKEPQLQSVNQNYLKNIKNPHEIQVVVKRCDEAELDEMWSFVRIKSNQRWLWHAIDHNTGEVLAYVFGKRQDVVFQQLEDLLKPFGIRRYYTDDWGAYERHLDEHEHHVGKRNTQKIERKHLTLRTRIKRLARKTICFSKLEKMHDIVIGLFINRYEFGLIIQ